MPLRSALEFDEVRQSKRCSRRQISSELPLPIPKRNRIPLGVGKAKAVIKAQVIKSLDGLGAICRFEPFA